MLADGSVVTCSPDNDPDLFYSVPWSYGTLGFLVSVEIDIVPSKRFVQLDYTPVYSLDQMVETFEREVERVDPATGAQADFVECLVFSLERAVVMTGRMVDSCTPGQLNHIGHWYKPWFFKHVEGFLSSGAGTEYIPLRHYYHRCCSNAAVFHNPTKPLTIHCMQALKIDFLGNSGHNTIRK